MTNVVSVRFKDNGKAYFFDPNGTQPKRGENVVVETAKGLEFGECAYECHEVDDEEVVKPLRPVVRIATENDKRINAANKEREKEAFDICRRKIADHGLDMKLVDVERSFDGSKILFFFTSDGRVDFRDLVKDLASVFRTRIELRQIGVRDEAKMLGGIGICGRPFCCNQFLDDFQPVSTKMAKVQSMSLNPAKISGSCGRLMCCLRYEYEAYEDMIKHSPKTGAYVETDAGYGTITQINLLRHQAKVKMDGEGEQVIKTFDTEDVAVVPGGRPSDGTPPPHVLQPREKPVEEEEPERDDWASPTLFAEELGEQKPVRAQEDKKKPQNRNNRRRGRGNGGGKQQDARQGGSKPQQGQNKQQKSKQQNQNRARQNQRSEGERPAGQQPNVQKNAGGNKSSGNRKRRYNGNRKPKPQNGSSAPKSEG